MIDAVKGPLVQSRAERARHMESGELKVVVGVNSFTETEPSPHSETAQHRGIISIDPSDFGHVHAMEAWRAVRDQAAVDAARTISPWVPTVRRRVLRHRHARPSKSSFGCEAQIVRSLLPDAITYSKPDVVVAGAETPTRLPTQTRSDHI